MTNINFITKYAPTKWLLVSFGLLVVFASLNQCTFNSEQTIDFNTQVKPILNQKCIHCHGGVKQSAGFSLMTREKALSPTDNGQPAILPGDADNSEFIRRLTAEDEEERMPFEAPMLSPTEIVILTQWVDEGANWGLHWAYESVQKTEVPRSEIVALGSVGETDKNDWAINEIDHFVLEKLNQNDLVPSELADKKAILRRLSLDLIGLSAPENLAAQFLQKENAITYEQLVDELLGLPQFGEKWASMWLDLARYADSKGFERDPNRSIYAYRDYLIRAFNEDMPYDQFLTEQLAGDLLPNPTDAQYIATGFHRNTPTNDEGGTDNEEYRVAAVIDRVNTTGQALLGSTFACVQCHGHPYDPFEHKEYYQMMAFFNNTRDMDTHKDYPLLRMYEPKNTAKLDQLIAWIKTVAGEKRAEEMRTFLKTWQPVIYSIDTDSLINAAFYDTKYLGFRPDGQAQMKDITLTGKNKLLLRGIVAKKGGRFVIRIGDIEGEIIADFNLKKSAEWSYEFLEIPLIPVEGKHDLFLQYENNAMTNPEAMGFQIDWFYFTEDFPGKGTPDYEENRQRFWELMEATPATTLISMENPVERPRTTRLFDRGSWLAQTEKVAAKVPTILNEFPENAPNNRLGLAQWLTDKKNPLTARTMVNRIWEQLFGMGLVETLEDLGTQGTPPTHPELLDWLSYQYMNDYEWSTKQLIRTVVTSATYRQSAKVSPDLLAKDPYNKLLTRGPRVRLSAEQIRDQTLAVSGLLSDKMYGPPVMPYQPDGIWSAPYSSDTWQMSEGEDRYRRAIYTFVKRSTPYPAMETFDVAPRQVCSSRRIRTNTPLQALVTLNDPVYVEAAKHFALKMQQQTDKSTAEQIAQGYELAIGKSIDVNKKEVLVDLYQASLKNYQTNPKAAQEIIGKLKSKQSKAETAAMTVVANAILNLDEFMMK